MHGGSSKEFKKDESLAIVVLGASGDLARKKTFPALFKLHLQNYLPHCATIIGYARSKMSNEDFHKGLRESNSNSGNPAALDSFVE